MLTSLFSEHLLSEEVGVAFTSGVSLLGSVTGLIIVAVDVGGKANEVGGAGADVVGVVEDLLSASISADFCFTNEMTCMLKLWLKPHLPNHGRDIYINRSPSTHKSKYIY